MERFMPPWQNRLSDEEIWDVVAFSFTLHTSEDEVRRGEQVWAENCASCHGDQGAGDGPVAVANGWSLPDLSNLELAASRSLDDWYQLTSQGQGNMPAFAGTLAEEDIWAALEYARTFTYRPAFAMALPKGDGRLVGVVANGTPGSEVPGDTMVTLRTFEGFDELASQEAQVAADGSFSFEELPTDPDYIYLVTTSYGGITFASDVASFSEGETEIEAPVDIWETSTTPGEITVNLAQWFVEYHQGALLVGELYRLTHESDRVYIGGEEAAEGAQSAVLEFRLPPEAQALTLEGGEVGERFILTRDGVADTQPLPPGQVQILMRYLLPYNGTTAELAHSIPYAAEEVNVLVAEGPRVRSGDLEEVGTQTIGEQQFVRFQATDLPADEEVGLEFRGLERPSGAAAELAGPNRSTAVLAYHPALLFGLAGLAAAVVVGLLLVPVVRRSGGRRKGASDSVEGLGAGPGDAGSQAAGPQSAAVGTAEQRQRVLRAIADLDDRFAAGELDEESYHQQRMAYKRQLVLLTRELEQASPAPAGEQGTLGETQEQA